MPPVKLTDRYLRHLKTEKTQEDFWDEKFPGSFGVRVTKRGAKTFIWRYRFGGQQRRFTLGRYPVLSLADAWKMALDLLGEVNGGKDPAEKRNQGRKSKTFKELADDYKARRLPKLREATSKEYTRIIDTYLLPVWGKRKFESITRREVRQLLDDVKENRSRKGSKKNTPAPYMANQTLALISTMFNFASKEDEEYTGVNPCTHVERPAKVKSRERVLPDKEIQALWKDLDDNRLEPAASVFRMILLTGQRPGEVKAMRWSAIKDEEGTAFLTSKLKDFVWTIPDSVAKNKKEHKVPLSSTSYSVLDKLRDLTGESEYVFAAPRGGHLKYLQKMYQRIRKSIRHAKPKGKDDFRPHDLRRTCATNLSILGISDLTIARILNHSVPALRMTEIYNRYEKLPEMKEALDRWGVKLERIVTGVDPAKVVSINDRR
jgi:integrase